MAIAISKVEARPELGSKLRIFTQEDVRAVDVDGCLQPRVFVQGGVFRPGLVLRKGALKEVLMYMGVDFNTGAPLPHDKNLGLGPDPDEVTLRSTGEMRFHDVPGHLTLWVREKTGNGKEAYR